MNRILGPGAGAQEAGGQPVEPLLGLAVQPGKARPVLVSLQPH